jgi:hypothetical protein
MRTVRGHLSWIAGIWLACQVGVLTTAPLSLAGIFVHGGAEGAICTCGTAGPGHYCPMHGKHQDHADTQPGPDECVLRSGSPASDVTLVSLISGIGLIPPAQATFATVATNELVLPLSAEVVFRSNRPESPPPRS